MGLAVAILGAGCSADWKQVSLAPQTRYPPRQEMQIWMHGESQSWHSIRTDSATLSGVPLFRPPDCDSCRITVPRTSVDSVRVGHPDSALITTLITIFALAGLGYWALIKPGG